MYSNLIMFSLLVMLFPEFYIDFKRVNSIIGLLMNVCVISVCFYSISQITGFEIFYNILITTVYIFILLTINLKVTDFYVSRAKRIKLPSILEIKFRRIKFMKEDTKVITEKKYS